MRLLLINILSLVCLTLSVHGTTYYVSTTGSDAASGLSVDSAWASINNGDATSVLSPGDTVYILPGVHSPDSDIQLDLAGSSTSPIFYRGAGAGLSAIDLGLTSGHGFDISANYTAIEGLEVRNGGKAGVRITSNGCIVRDCYIHDVGEDGIYTSGDDNLFEKNLITHTGQDGIEIDGEDNLSFHNTVYYPGDRGIHYKAGVTDGRIFNNIVVGSSEGIRGKETLVSGFNNLWLNSTDYANGVSDSAGGLVLDPMFVDTAAGDFTLQPGSPCLNAGLWLDYPWHAAAPDMGAFELLQIGGATYYVSPTGDDGADGLSEINAWASIDNGDKLKVLLPGDTVNILAGTYSVTDTIFLHTSGTPFANVTYREVADSVLVDGTGGTGNAVLMIMGSQTVVSGLELYDGSWDGIWVTGDSNVVSDCFIHDMVADGVDVGGVDVSITDNLMLRNIVASCGESGFENDSTASKSVYHHNTVYDNAESGIGLRGSTGTARVFNNIVVSNGWGIPGALGNVAGFNDVWNSTWNDWEGGLVDSAGVISADPLFADAAAANFYPRVTSPVRDAGLDLGYPYLGTAPDMGAVEATPHTPTNYYVSTTGADGNSGLDTANAWATIDNGDNKGLIGPGDTINVLPGTYPITSTAILPTGGSGALPIVYRGWGDGESVFDLGDAVDEVLQVDGSNIHLCSLTVANAGRHGVLINGDSCLVSHCVVKDVLLQGVDVYGSNNLVYRTLVYDAGESGLVNRAGAENNRYYNNTVKDCPLDGVWIEASVTTARIFNNILVAASEGIEGAPGNICGFNDIWNSVTSDYVGGVSDSAGGISADPMFQNPSGKDFSLKKTSPAIDTALDLGFSFHGPAPDMGALEFMENYDPVIAVPGPVTTTEGANESFAVAATDDFDIPSLTSSTLPTGATFTDNGDGTADFDWTPDFLQSGVHDIVFYATDDSSAVDSGTVTITVSEAGNQLPVLAAIGGRSTGENIALSFGVSASDPESTPTLTTAALPTGAGFVDNGDGTGSFDWTPNFLQSGSYDVTFYATDDSLAVDSEVVAITVNEVGNQLPVLSPVNDTSTTEWVNLTFAVSATDTESTPTLTTSALPTGAGFVDNGDGTGDFDWTPSYPQAGAYSITFYALDDSLAVDSAVVSIDVDSTTTAYITVSPDTGTVATDSSMSFAVNGFNAGGQQSRHGNVVWSLTVPLGVIDSSGVFDPDTPGSTRVIAVSNLGLIDTSGTIDVVVGALASLTVAPDSVQITTDSSAVFSVTGTDADGNPVGVGTTSWSLTDNIGTIDGAGVFTPTASGTTRVVAVSSLGGVTDTSNVLIVTPGELVRIEISPEADTLRHGDSVQFIATGYDDVNSPAPTGPIDWAVLGNIGTIDTAGWLRATGTGIGYVVPSASLHGLADTSGVVAVEAVTVQALGIGNSYLLPGESNHVLLSFTLANGLSHDLEIEGLTLRDAFSGAGSTAELLSNVDSIAIYRDTDDDAAVTGADSRLAGSTMSEDTVHFSFAPVTVQAASSETFIATVASSWFPRDGDSLDVYFAAGSDLHIVGDSTEIAGVDSVNSSGVAVIDGMLSRQLTLTSTGLGTISPADTAYHVFTVDLPRNGYQIDTLTSFSVTNIGTGDDSDVDSLVLYRDNSTGFWEGSDEEQLVSRLWYTGSQWTGSGLAESLTEQTTRFYVGAYLAEYPANGVTLAFTVPQNGLDMASQNDGPLDAAPEPVDTITILASETVTVESVTVPGLSLIPGEISSPLTGLEFTNSYGVPVGIDSLRFVVWTGNDAGASQAQLDSQIDSLLLYWNRDGLHDEITTLDTLLASAPVIDGQAVFATGGLQLAGGGGIQGLSVVSHMNLRNCRNENTINIGLLDAAGVYLSGLELVDGTFPLSNDADHYIDIFVSAAVAINLVPSATLYGAQTSEAVLDFEIPRNGYAPDELSRISLENAGTVRSDEALSRCRLFADAADDGFTDDDLLVGQFTFVGGQWVLTDLTHSLTNLLTRMFVVVDITSDQSDGGTLQFQIPVGGIEYESGTAGPDDVAVGNPEAHLVFPSNRVTAISIPNITRSVYPGSTDNLLLTYALYNGYVGQVKSLSSIAVTNTTRSASDSAFADGELGQVSLYLDADNDRALNGDLLVASGFVTDGRLVFAGLDIALPPESLSYFFVVADVPLNAIDSDSLSIAIEDPSDFSFSEETIVNGDLPLSGGGSLIVDGSVIAQYELQGLIPRTLSPGDTSVTLFAFRPAINGDQIDTLESVTVTNLLDATSGDISTIEIWLDVDADGVWQTTDSLLSAASYVAGGWNAGGLGVEISEDNRPVLFAVGDISTSAAPNVAFQGALQKNSCLYASGNDGPVDTALISTNTFTVSQSGLRVSVPPLNETYSVGQTIDLRFAVTNVQTVQMTDVGGQIVAMSDSTRVVLTDSVVGPEILEAGESTEFSFQFTADQPGDISWQIRAVSDSFPDSSAVIQTTTATIQSLPSNVVVKLVNSIPTAATRGQTNIFPMTLRIEHPDTAHQAAAIKVESLRFNVEDSDRNPIDASAVFSQLALATGYGNVTSVSPIPPQSTLTVPLNEPVIVGPGENLTLSLMASLDSSATADDFALSVEDASALPIVDENSLLPVAIVPATAWPLQTASCRIEDPSWAGAVSYVPLLSSQVNYGQANVPLLQLNLRHPGASGSSQIQLTEMSFAFLDDSGAAIEASELFENVSLLKQQMTIGMASGPQLETSILDLPLSSPLTLAASQIDSIIIVASLRDLSAVSGFSLVVSDSTQLVIRDLSSGFRLEALSDTLLSTTTVFPASSGLAHLRIPASPPQVCMRSLLPSSTIGGADSLELVEYLLVYEADDNSSPIRLTRAGLVALDSTNLFLDPTRLFDRIGYRLEGGSLQYQTFVETDNGATIVNFADPGLLVEPGDSVMLTFVADIEADVPYDNFKMQARFTDALRIWDATDATLSLSTVSAEGCSGGWPFSTGVTEIFLAAGRPGVRPEETRVIMAQPGETGLTVFEGDLSYESESPQGDISLGGIQGQVMRRTAAGLVPAAASDLFANVTLMLDAAPVAVDSVLENGSIVCLLDTEFDLSRGNTLPLALSCDLSPTAVPGNYVIRFADSTFIEATDKNLFGAVYPTLSASEYPVLSAELSVSEAGLESSFTNYPNPFNPSRGEHTIIGFTLEEPAQIDIELFTITGEAVKVVADKAPRNAGSHQTDTWFGKNGKGRDVVPGTYFCRLTVRYMSGKTETFRRKIAVVR